MCGLDRSSGFGGCRLQHPPKPPTVFGARCVSRSPMKYLKHVLKLHVQYLPKYGYTRYIHPLLARTRSPKYNKAQSKRKANPREVACERQTFLFAHRRWGTFRKEERLRFSDRNSILMTQNLSGIRSEALIGRRSRFIVLAIVYKWQTKDKRPQRSNVKAMNL